MLSHRQPATCFGNATFQWSQVPTQGHFYPPRAWSCKGIVEQCDQPRPDSVVGTCDKVIYRKDTLLVKSKELMKSDHREVITCNIERNHVARAPKCSLTHG